MDDSSESVHRRGHGFGLRKRFAAVYALIVGTGLLATVPLGAIAVTGLESLYTLPASYESELSYSLSSGFFVATTLQGQPIRVDADFSMFCFVFGTSCLLSVFVLIGATYGLCSRSTERELLAVIHRAAGRESVVLCRRLRRCAISVAVVGASVGGSLAVAFPAQGMSAVGGICVGLALVFAFAMLARLGYRRILGSQREPDSDSVGF